MCKPHVCKGLADSTVRQIHWILSGALDRAVVWGWIAVNPAEHASKPGMPTPDPRPPTVDEVGRLLTEAWVEDEDWGRLPVNEDNDRQSTRGDVRAAVERSLAPGRRHVGPQRPALDLCERRRPT